MRVLDSPVGGSRIAWSYLAAVLAAVVCGVVLAIADPLSSAYCAPDDVNCSLGFLLAAGMVGAIGAYGLVAWVFRLGWEWWAILAAGIAGFPSALGALGGWVVVLLVAMPGIAALATLRGTKRARWRPWVIGGSCLAVGVASFLLMLGPGQ